MIKRKVSLCLVFLLTLFNLCSCQTAGISSQDEPGIFNEYKEAIGQETAQDIGQEALQDAEQETVQDTGQEALQDAEPEPAQDTGQEALQDAEPEPAQDIARDGEYTKKEDVALYLHLYGELPPNFITKKEASALGWEGGSLEPYAPGKSIGGDYFGNYEKKLPVKKGREYHECDIDTKGASKRGSKRIVYSNDGLIYYTEDHYETFELLYGEE